MTDQDLLWKQYQQNVDLYKFYMEQTLRLEVFYYAVTGAIFSYYFTNTDIEFAQYGLFLPLMMSLGLCFFCIYGAALIQVTREETFEIRDKLNLAAAPDLGVLAVLLRIFAFIKGIISLACIYLIWFA